MHQILHRWRVAEGDDGGSATEYIQVGYRDSLRQLQAVERSIHDRGAACGAASSWWMRRMSEAWRQTCCWAC